MIHPVPPGTRDVLPDEMRELRALSGSLHATFDRAGFGEVWTPALEYEEVLRRGDERAAAGFRLFDDRGHVLALRSDATIPIARLVANRYATEPAPLRLCYFAHAYRAVERGSGQAREFLQGGIELTGVADRVIFDLGLLRDLGYYTGTIFEVYDPAVAFALGGGGRYDELLGRFGPSRPACGAGLDIQRVHVAQIEEERGT